MNFIKKPVVLILTTIILALGLITAVHFITKPSIEKNEKNRIMQTYQRVLPEMTDFEVIDKTLSTPISEAVIAKKQNGDILGYVYVASGSNTYGTLKLITALDQSGKIIKVDYIELNQTADFAKRVTDKLSGFNQNDAKSPIDLQSGASYTEGTTKDLLKAIGNFHATLGLKPLDPLAEWFGEGYTKEAISNLTLAELTDANQILVSGSAVGAVYGLSISAQYNDEGSEGSIKVIVGLDAAGKIVGIELPQAEYHHSSGGFYNTAVQNAQKFVGVNIANLSSHEDFTSGATYSSDIVAFLLGKLAGVLGS